jgi:hypothetical protein
MNLKILLLPGDGIGTEVTAAAVDVLKTVGKKFGHTLELTEGLLGGIAIHKTGTPFPKETEELCQKADTGAHGCGGIAGVRCRAAESAVEAGSSACDVCWTCSPTCARCGRGPRWWILASEEPVVTAGHDHRPRLTGLRMASARDRQRSRVQPMSYTRKEVGASRILRSSWRGTAAGFGSISQCSRSSQFCARL